MPPKREIQVRFLLAVPTPAPFASQRGLFFCHAPNSPTPNSMTRPFRPSGRPSAQNANGSSFAPNPTPRGSRHVAPHSTPGAGGRRLCARFPMRAQSDAMTRKPCPPPPLGGGAMPRAERIAGWAGARFFPPRPSFFSRPLFISSSAPPPSFRWMLRVGPSTGDAIRGAARQGSSDGKTPSADHRSVPTSWRKSSARQSGCLCKPTTQINAANQAVLGQGHAALAIHNRFAAAAGVTQRRAACLERPCFPTLSDNAWARRGRRLESRRRRRGIRRGEEGRKRLRSAKPPKPPKPIRADDQGRRE